MITNSRPGRADRNIAYKITHRVAGAQALGPLLQGLDGVVLDLSRGRSADDVYDVGPIAAYQSLSLPVGRSEFVKGQGNIT